MKFLALLFLFAGLAGCSNDCNSEIIETTQLTNKTQQELKIELCKIPFEQVTGQPGDTTETRITKAEFTISQKQTGVFLIDRYPTTLKKEGSSCSKELPPSYSTQIFLTSKSFSQFKLCRDDEDPTKATLTLLTSNCPDDSTAQAQAVVECDKTALVE